MSNAKSKTDLVRLAWLTALRRQGGRQCGGSFSDSRGRVCALGLLQEVALRPDEIILACWDDIDAVGALAGLNPQQSWDVTYRNDGDDGHAKHTFAEIADVVAGWFAEAPSG
jgi:hypothetical protein